jgi:competence protein ComEC
MKTYPVIGLTLLFASGIAVSPFLRLPVTGFLLILSLLIIFVIIISLFRNDLIKLIIIFLTSATAFYAGNLYHIPNPEFEVRNIIHKEEVEFFGTVTAINIGDKDERRFTAASDSLVYQNTLIPFKGDFYCVEKRFDKKSVLYPGYKFQMKGTYIKGKNIRNPGEFNYEEYLKKAGISGYIYSSTNAGLIITEKEEYFFAGLVYRVRSYISGIIDKLHSRRTSALLNGILLADRKDIEHEIRTDFINSGTAHVLAVSGLHVGFIILIFIIITGRFNLYIRSVITILAIIAFIFITGAPPSVLRASLMAVILITGFLTNRSTNIFNSLALSALLILLYDPSHLFLPGFQLSYMAVISIGIFYPMLLARINSFNINNYAVRKFLLFSAVSVSAQIGVLPLVLFYYSKLSLVSVAANIMVVPLIGMIVGIAFITLVAAPVFLPLAEIFASANELMNILLAGSVSLFGSLSFSFLWVHDFSMIDCLISYILIIILIVILKKSNTRYFKYAAALLVIFMIVLFTSFDNKQLLKENLLNCYMIDVGQGDAILLKFPSGKTALIDAGETTASFDTGEKIIEPLLNYFGITKIDYAFISHLDSDHYSGFIHLIKKGYINYLYKPPPDTTQKEIKFERFLSECGVDYSYYSGKEIKIDKTKIYILDNSMLYNKRINSNDLSGVLLLVYGETSFIFTGDAGFKAEELYIKQYGDLLKVNVLKVSHHGSASATSVRFLEYTNPEISLITAGEKNKFGHPSRKTLERLNKIETTIYRTDEEGGILLQSDGSKVYKVNWKK